jgi:hypothetical protein
MPAIERLSISANGVIIHATPTRAGHMADRLHNSLKHADVVLADCDQQSQRRSDIEQRRRSLPPHATAPGKFSARIPDFVAHYRSKFEPDQAEANDAERIQHKPGIGRNSEVSGRYGRAKTRPRPHPKPIRTAAINVPMAPRLLSHFPTPSPTILRPSAAQAAPEAAMAKFLLSASAAWPGPIANTDTPTKYSITVGTYSMLFVQ